MIDIYLACPYSDPDPIVRLNRFNKANICTAKLIENGYTVFNPIGHGHPINTIAKDIKIDWLKFDFEILEICRFIYILMLPGWKTSIGVTKEIEYAKSIFTPITYLDSKEWV